MFHVMLCIICRILDYLEYQFKRKISEGPNLLRFSSREVLKCKIESYLIILHLSTLPCHKQPEPRMHSDLFLDQYYDYSKYQCRLDFKMNSIIVLNIRTLDNRVYMQKYISNYYRLFFFLMISCAIVQKTIIIKWRWNFFISRITANSG